ncbi:Histone-lysine N-methyltransferase [Bertholletia excelsa]
MAFSDEEDEAVPNIVSNYHFVDDKDEPIAFSELPVQWNEEEEPDGKKKQIFLHGMTDNGLQKIYKQIKAWKFDLSDLQPGISVLSRENNWIKLQKPRKSFEDTIRTILITLHCLHFLKKNPDTCGKSLWSHLSKVFRSYEVGPSVNDLIDHTRLISEVVRRDETLAKSKFLVKFIEEKPQKQKALYEGTSAARTRFIVDDDGTNEAEGDESDEEDDLFDSVCAICDNGGELLCCEGRCLRSFHATVEDGLESSCRSLGFTREQVEATQNYLCKNCQYQRHQCFICGELGSSDKSAGAEVFPCLSATCGHFYHPYCVAKMLHRESATAAEQLRKKIAAGESFTCPIHKCIVCDQFEDKTVKDLQFAICRRCPKSYHRKCLPREIVFEYLEDEDIVQRAWEDLIPNRILIYCLEHEIDDEILTPSRDHIKFPDDGQKKKKLASQQLSGKERIVQKDKSLASEDATRKSTFVKVQKRDKSSSTFIEVDSSKKIVRTTGLETLKRQKVEGTTKKPLNKIATTKVSKSAYVGNKRSLGNRLFDLYTKDSEPDDAKNKDTPDNEYERSLTAKPIVSEINTSVQLDDNSKKRILSLMKDATASITLEHVLKKQKVPTTHSWSSRNMVDKTITMGKVEGSVEALRAALEKLEEGCSIDDAKALCEPKLLHQIFRWKNKMKVYLAPFLYGMRYTSFGRHFTKVEKLKQIVEVLHYYVQEGDMIVDFSCGANDFSWLMKQKLEETGKKCFFKNYDIIQTKIDFNFERKDWFEVERKELPSGSKLIIGLNPPFGVQAALANKFINKALEFEPKLLILIVPQETERLDKKENPYNLVWEDDELLAGKSFYLPGSVDVNDNQMEDWNVNPPPLYLWSHPDWTAEHKEIAEKHGHLTRIRGRSFLDDQKEPLASDYPKEVDNCKGQNSKPVVDSPFQNEVQEKPLEQGESVSEGHKKTSPCNNGDGEAQDNSNHKNGKDKSREDSWQRKRGKGNHQIGLFETSQERKDKRRCSPIRETYDRKPCHPQPNAAGGISLDTHSSRPIDVSSDMENIEDKNDKLLDQNVPSSRSLYQTEYGASGVTDYSARGYRLNAEESYTAVNASHGYHSYGFRNSDEHFAVYHRDNTNHGYGPYATEVRERYARDSVIRSQPRFYGQQEHDSFSQRSSYLAGLDPRFSSYSHLGSAADLPYSMMSTSSTMQRYAPRLDELNHTTMNPAASRSGIPDPLALAPQPGYRIDTLGFAPGPYHPYGSRQNTSGWLNE